MPVLGLTLLIVSALTLRLSAAALRTDASSRPLRCVGWLLAAVAAWVATGVAGAWAPLWPALLVTALGIVDRGGRSLKLWVGVDVLLVVSLGLLSVPVLAPLRIGVTALVMAATGLSSDLAVRRCPAAVHRAVRWGAAPVAIGVFAFLAFALMPPIGDRRPRDWREAVSLSSAIGPSAVPGERRITLGTGAVAWFDASRSAEPYAGALFFHGNHPDGSHQPAALVARRALVHAGFAVLAVDHPGYGTSPHPGVDADLTAWDPLPTDLAAYDALRSIPGVRSVIAFGHSMGNLDVVNLLRVGVPVHAAVMIGAGYHEPGREEYWDVRFFSDRGMTAPPEGFPVRELRQRYFDIKRLVAELSAGHAPVRFVNFGVESPDVAAVRDQLYDLLPGRKEVWTLADTTHFLSTEDWRRVGLLIGDTRAALRLVAALDGLD